LEASQQFSFYRVGLLAPRPTPIPEGQASVFTSPRGRVATHFSRLLRHAWVTVGLFSFPGHHTGMSSSSSCSLIFTLISYTQVFGTFSRMRNKCSFVYEIKSVS
jgi:hypothetical protein